MADTLQLRVLTPEGERLNASAEEMTAESPLGEFGVLPGHTYLVTRIAACTLRYRSGGQNESLEVAEGFCRIGDDRVTLLVEKAGPGAAQAPEPVE